VKSGLFYVFAFVPDDSPNRFFVLTQAQVNEEVEAENERIKARALVKAISNPNALNFRCGMEICRAV
jgi:hypothetical protein